MLVFVCTQADAMPGFDWVNDYNDNVEKRRDMDTKERVRTILFGLLPKEAKTKQYDEKMLNEEITDIAETIEEVAADIEAGHYSPKKEKRDGQQNKHD